MMKVEPTPMAAIWATSSSSRNGGRTIHASASPANRIMLPKSSNHARSRAATIWAGIIAAKGARRDSTATQGDGRPAHPP